MQHHKKQALLQAIATRADGNFQIALVCITLTDEVANAQPRNIQRETRELDGQKTDFEA